MPTPILRKSNPVLLGYAGAGHPFPAASAQALVSGMSKRVRANVPAPKEEHFMSDERVDLERPCLHCMIVELIDDFFDEYPAATDEADTIDPDGRSWN